MKNWVILCLVLLITPTCSAQTMTDTVYEMVRKCPDIQDARVTIDKYHVGIVVFPNIYAIDVSKILPYCLDGYIQVLLSYPEYDGYLRIGLVENTNKMKIYETDASTLRKEFGIGSNGTGITSILDDMFKNRKTVTRYWTDSYGDTTKPVESSEYGRLSASDGNWL